jgi:hypothetical protein
VYLQDLVAGPHTRGHGFQRTSYQGEGVNLTKGQVLVTGVTGYDVASLAPEPSTQWQAGTEECVRACEPIFVCPLLWGLAPVQDQTSPRKRAYENS